MVWKNIHNVVLTNFNHLYRWKWGYLVSSFSLSLLIFLLGMVYQYSFLDSLLIGDIEGFVITGIIFAVKRYGLNGFITKILEVVITTIIGIAKVVFVPLQALWDAFLGKIVRMILLPFRFLWHILFEIPKWILTKRIPELLPFVLKPLYKFSGNVILAGIAYLACWVLYSVNYDPKDFLSISLLGQQYNITITGACVVGIILGIPLLELIAAYHRMFWGWLGKIKWEVKLFIHW